MIRWLGEPEASWLSPVLQVSFCPAVCRSWVSYAFLVRERTHDRLCSAQRSLRDRHLLSFKGLCWAVHQVTQVKLGGHFWCGTCRRILIIKRNSEAINPSGCLRVGKGPLCSTMDLWQYFFLLFQTLLFFSCREDSQRIDMSFLRGSDLWLAFLR